MLPGENSGPDAAAFARHRRKYALIERERRFLLAGLPETAPAAEPRMITDRYLTATRLRLRRVDRPGAGLPELKLTQKVPAGRPGPVQGLITTLYLSPAEYDVLVVLPAAIVFKTRHAIPPLVVDVFAGHLRGLVLAEAEFGTDEAAAAFEPPAGTRAEVTGNPRFTGGRLARARRADLLSWLADDGIRRCPAGAPPARRLLP